MDYIKTWNGYKEISSVPYWGIFSNLDAGGFRVNPYFEFSADFKDIMGIGIDFFYFAENADEDEKKNKIAIKNDMFEDDPARRAVA